MTFFFLQFSLIGLIGLLVFVGFDLWFYSTSKPITGTVVELKEKKEENGSVKYSPVYSYEDQLGTHVTSSQNLWTNPSLYSVGDSIDLRVKKDKSKVSNFLGLFGLSVFMFAVMFLVFFLPSLFTWRWTEKKLRQNKTPDLTRASFTSTRTSA